MGAQKDHPGRHQRKSMEQKQTMIWMKLLTYNVKNFKFIEEISLYRNNK